MTVPGQGQEPAPQAGQEPGEAQPSAQPQTPPAAGQEPAPAGQPERYDAEYVKDLRKSEAATRKKLQEAEARLKEADDQKLSETERLQKRADEAEQRAKDAEAKARQALVRSAVMVELGKQGATNPSLIFALVDQGAIEMDDDGNVTGADKAVERLLKDEPYLVGQASGNGAATKSVPGTPKPAGPVTEDQKVDAIYQRIRETSGAPRW